MERDCQVIFTTSRRPTKITLEVLNDLVNSLPSCGKIVRGKKSFATILEEAVARGARRVVFLWDRRGMPSRMLIYDIVNGWTYVLKIVGIIRRGDRAVIATRRPPAKNAVIVDLARSELGDIFMEVFQYPIMNSLEAARGRFDTVILIRRMNGYVVDILGRELGPRAVSLKIGAVIYRHV